MNYQETIHYLYNQLPVYQNVGGVAYKEGLDNSLALDKYFGYPHKKYKTIHVGGTNGKGSTSHLLAAILQQSGYKVGLYTSPHLMDFRERIRVNGEKVSEDYVVDFVAKYKDCFQTVQPSFFELTMMMAFCYFADMDVEIAVIEVGLGGRLDSTNIITPVLSVITNVSLDHTQYLGDTVEKIAIEKAGIIKPHVAVVIGEAEGEIRKIFEEKAQAKSSPVTFAQDRNLIESAQKQSDGIWMFRTKKYPDLSCELRGLPQVKNAATVLSSLDILLNQGIDILPQAVYDGFARVTELTGLMGRWQVIQQAGPRIICDTAHNTGGIKYVVEQLSTEQYRQLHIVIGMVNDKHISSVLALLPDDAIYYFTRASISRALDEKKLSDEAALCGLRGDVYPTVESAVLAAQANAGDNDLVFIGGSNFVVAEALEFFRNHYLF